MYTNKATINTTASANGGSNFTTNNYWSSTEYGNSWGVVQRFDSNNFSYSDKGYSYNVRAVRAF